MSQYKRVKLGSGDRLRALTKKYGWVADKKKLEAKAGGNQELYEAYEAMRVLFELFVEVDHYVGNIVGMTEAIITDERCFRETILGTPEGSELIAHLKQVKPELFRKMEEERGYSA